LVAAFDIDDAEAAHAHAEIAIDQQTCVVRAAMNQAVALIDDGAARDRPAASPVPACNSTH
jgi:hypothetical protein